MTAGSGDTLRVVSVSEVDTRRIAATRIAALDVSVGRHKRRWSGAGIGFAAGALLGAGAGAARYRSNSCTGDFCDLWGPWPNVVAGVVLLGGTGAVIGAVHGYGTADTWSPLIRNGARRHIAAGTARRNAVGASLRF